MKDLSRLTVEERAGQLFFLGFHGPEPDSDARSVLDLVRPGGIVLSQRNLSNFSQTCRLTTSFTNRDIPAFVAIHQEGGAADRLRQLFAPLPSMAQAAHEGTAQLRLLARIIGLELEAAGFNTLFGPVLDLAVPSSILGDRALAASPASTSRLGRAVIEEVSDRGLLACTKHFPGMGAAPRDPHFFLPEIDKPKKWLMIEDIAPFVNLFDVTPMIMVGHAHYPALHDGKPTPASLSHRIVDGLLRKKLGFPGVILTDDMTMGAVTSQGLTPELFLHAFEAGNDMLVFSQTTPVVTEAFRAIVKAVKRSSSLAGRLDAAVRRILSLKASLNGPAPNPDALRTRILRHIDRLTRGVEVAAKSSVTNG